MKPIYLILLLSLLIIQPVMALEPANIKDVILDNPTYTYNVGQPMSVRIDFYNPYYINGQATNLRYRYTLWFEKTNSKGVKYWAVDTYDSIKISVAGGEIYTTYLNVNPPQVVGVYRYKITTEKYYNGDWRNDDSKIFSINVVNPTPTVTEEPTSDSGSSSDSGSAVVVPSTYSLTITSNVEDFYVACENIRTYSTGKTAVLKYVPINNKYTYAVCKEGYYTEYAYVSSASDVSLDVTLSPIPVATTVNETKINESITIGDSIESNMPKLVVYIKDENENALTKALININGYEQKSLSAGNTFDLYTNDFTIVVTKEGYNAVIEEYEVEGDTELTIIMEETVIDDTYINTDAANVEILTNPTVKYDSISTSTYVYGIMGLILVMIVALVYKMRKGKKGKRK